LFSKALDEAEIELLKTYVCLEIRWEFEFFSYEKNMTTPILLKGHWAIRQATEENRR
jgi:hypothetical protein